MKITREQLKEIVREVMTEESEYQTFFKKALEKTGKSIPQMSDEEKKTFFNKIDAAWKGKGEKKESVNEEKYTVIDPKGNSLGTAEKNQVVMAAKKRGGEKAGYFVVSAKNALKARRALEKFKGDFKNPKLKDIMSGLYESVNESLLKEWKLEVDLGKVNPKRFDRFVDKSFQKSFKIDVAGSGSNRVIIGRGKDDSEGISAGFMADNLDGEFGNKIKMKIDGKPLKFRGL